MIVFLGPSQWHYNLRLTERAKMTLSRAQNIVMPKNINFVLFHCKGTFGPERYLRRRLEIRRTLRTFKCAQIRGTKQFPFSQVVWIKRSGY